MLPGQLLADRNRIAAAHTTTLTFTAAEIKALIEERGHDVLEIADLIRGGQKKRRGQGAAKRTSNYPAYANPDNPEQVYTRGRRPQWFTEKMLEHGFDPEKAEDRQTFKEQHLTKISA